MHDTTKPYLAEIERLTQTTWNTTYVKVDQYGMRIKPNAPKGPLYLHVDGIGPKGEDHLRLGTYDYAAQDSLAMNLNDAARDRAIIFGVGDHIMLPADDHEAMVTIVASLAHQCRARNLAILAGEPAIHIGNPGLEISMSVIGVTRSMMPNCFQEGDVLIGIESSGLHSNGFTRLHSVFDAWEDLPPSIVTPTLIYYDRLTQIDELVGTHGREHISGGAFFKMKKHLVGVDAHIHRNHILIPQPIFGELVKRGISEEEMYKTFNCGIGFVIGVDENVVPLCLKIIRQDFNADIIGDIRPGNGTVHIESMFSEQTLSY